MNKYEIIGIVGEGAYGIVYKAKCKETGEFGTSAPYAQFKPANPRNSFKISVQLLTSA